jgi:hypothetical protein
VWESKKDMATQLSASQSLSLSSDERVLFVKQDLGNSPDGTLTPQNLKAGMTCLRKGDVFSPKGYCEYSRLYRRQLGSNGQPLYPAKR